MATSPDTTSYFAGNYPQGPGLSSVGSYQIAGTPYLSSSTLAAGKSMEFALPAVSKRIFIENTTNNGANTEIYLSFQPASDVGVATLGHVYPIASPYDINAPSATFRSGSVPYIDLNIKCNKFYLMAGPGGTVSYNIVAELTGIAPGQMFELTGSGINDV